ncbi:efflux RND transporter periplasmic adaptor subunit [Erythrobacter sp.]|uniref:efflux RND transporter periplasmic adaptor subunit n=1 Tax=Erythrobacter sp. TaxID=1042 RepID=UPI001AFD3FAD|nr:efflux RND transporter periplasmic adaptor subunit [Erythrobacter sp.]MBO6526456.1 efflux RND transporter periplasmic adaptor subunit [Erythrobacter sp.]MBO6529331.1 efflux RND transporter periplasmic adaptor subunit [Erythrobacter sp.]
MWKRIKRWRWALLIAGLLMAGFLYALWPEAVAVDTGTVTRGEMTVGITDDGVTRADEYYVVSAPVTGYLSRIELEPGDAVGRGALITRMTGRPSSPLDQRSRDEMRGALASARAAESGATAALGQARRDLRRAEELSERGFLPRAQLEAARTRVATERSAQQQARADIARLRAMLTDPSGAASGAPVAVRAPAGGEVLSVINESEGVIVEGTPLVTIGNPDTIEVVVDLLSREAVRVKPGDRVEINQWGGSDPLLGTVERIEPFGRLKISALGIEEQRVNVIIGFAEGSAGQGARLGHGYQVDATIELWRSEDALRLPIGALFRGPEGEWQVFAIERGRARVKTVDLGRINDEHAELLGGLDQGALVVVNPGSAIEDGTRVALRE